MDPAGLKGPRGSLGVSLRVPHGPELVFGSATLPCLESLGPGTRPLWSSFFFFERSNFLHR